MGLNLSRDLLRSASRIAIIAATAVLLGGCGGAGVFSSDAAESGPAKNLPAELANNDYVAGAAFWGAKFEANRADTNAALSFARNLRLMGGAKQALVVMKEVVMKNPDDPRVLAEYGKVLSAVGRPQDAVPFLARSVQMDDDDWTTVSAYGVALDQTGNHSAAQQNYQAALKLSTSNPSIESNLAMSYVLEGRIADAEPILRRLVARPDATAQMRQNLALVASLKGDATEANKLASEDLSVEDAANNMMVLHQLDARNAAVNVEMLPPPPATPMASPPSAMIEAPAKPPVVQAAVEKPAEPKAEEPKAAEAPAIAAPAITEMKAVASPAPKPAPVMMEPVREADEMPAATKATSTPKVLTPSPAKTTAVVPAAETKPAAAIAPAKDKTAETAAKPALRQSYDVYRRPTTVAVANAN